MGNDVFANGREISCKAAEGKSICAFPDVCLTPPTPPAGFLPIPYPNTGFATDTTNGSRTVKISGKEVMLKNKSFFKKSTGDEAATRSTPMGVLTHTITGKVYFTSWSMDVKVEGENVVRMADLTTHNHMSVPGNTPPWLYCDAVAVSLSDPCVGDMKKEAAACKDFEPHGKKNVCDELAGKKPPQKARDVSKPLADALADETALQDCISRRRCALQTYKPNTCCPPQTPHHLVEASSFFETRPHGEAGNPLGTFPNAPTPYSEHKAPCVCAEGVSHALGGTHELMHTFQSAAAMKAPEAAIPLATGGPMTARATTYKQAKKSGIEAFQQVFQDSGCSSACLEAQLDSYHNRCGITDDTQVKAVVTREVTDEMVEAAIDEANMRYSEVLITRYLKAG